MEARGAIRSSLAEEEKGEPVEAAVASGGLVGFGRTTERELGAAARRGQHLHAPRDSLLRPAITASGAGQSPGGSLFLPQEVARRLLRPQFALGTAPARGQPFTLSALPPETLRRLGHHVYDAGSCRWQEGVPLASTGAFDHGGKHDVQMRYGKLLFLGSCRAAEGGAEELDVHSLCGHLREHRRSTIDFSLCGPRQRPPAWQRWTTWRKHTLAWLGHGAIWQHFRNRGSAEAPERSPRGRGSEGFRLSHFLELALDGSSLQGGDIGLDAGGSTDDQPLVPLWEFVELHYLPPELRGREAYT